MAVSDILVSMAINIILVSMAVSGMHVGFFQLYVHDFCST
jgi:hypothetical protein